MEETTPFTIGDDASCTDGACGKLCRVVVDPVARALTHLVIEPKHEHGQGRLVPVDLVDTAPGAIRLHCTKAEFEKLDPAEETDFRPASGQPGFMGYGSEQVLSWRYYGLITGDDTGLDSSAGPGRGHAMRTVTYDSVPLGEVEVRHGDRVHATDGEIGLVEGLVIDPRNHHVTHVLLQEGHLWGRKEVAIPISAVTRVVGIRLNISKQQVGDLPPVAIDHLSYTNVGLHPPVGQRHLVPVVNLVSPAGAAGSLPWRSQQPGREGSSGGGNGIHDRSQGKLLGWSLRRGQAPGLRPGH